MTVEQLERKIKSAGMDAYAIEKRAEFSQVETATTYFQALACGDIRQLGGPKGGV